MGEMKNYIMHRSFAENWAKVRGVPCPWPKEIALIDSGRRVTFAELKAQRVERQTRHLRKVEAVEAPVRHAAYVWVFYQPGLFGFAYMGWWLYIRALTYDWAFSFRSFEAGLTTLDIMRQFPCGVLPLEQNFEQWKPAFAKAHWRPGRFPKQGLLPGWVECKYAGGWPQRFTPKEGSL
jgi:hypothetical protein